MYTPPTPPPPRSAPKGLYAIVGILLAGVIGLIIVVATLLPRASNSGATVAETRPEPAERVTETVLVPAPAGPIEDQTPTDIASPSSRYITLYETQEIRIPKGGCSAEHSVDLDEPRIDPEFSGELVYTNCASEFLELRFDGESNVTTTVPEATAEGCALAVQTSAVNRAFRPRPGMRICAQTRRSIAGNLVLIDVKQILKDGTVVLDLTAWTLGE